MLGIGDWRLGFGGWGLALSTGWQRRCGDTMIAGAMVGRSPPTPYNRPFSAVDVLRRELFRHHTRTLLLNELQQWIGELKGMRLYQLCTIPDAINHETKFYGVHQYMTEKEAAEVNATFEANRERLRWEPVDSSGEEWE